MLKKMLTTTLVSAALMMVPNVWAHGGGGMMGGGMMGGGMMGNGMMGSQQMGPGMMNGYRLMDPIQALLDYGLTDRQIDRLIDLHAKLIKEQLPLLRRQHELSDQVADIRESDSPDLNEMQTDLSDLGNVNAELEVGFMKVRQEAMATLTPEERQALNGQDLPLFGSNWGMGYGSVRYRNQHSGSNGSMGMMGGGMMGQGMSAGSHSHSH